MGDGERMEKIDMATPPAGTNLTVNAIVARRNKQPYVQISNDKGMIEQFTVGEARHVANTLLLAASRAEADAMILQFFDKEEFPEGAGAALMQQFRDFRHELGYGAGREIRERPRHGREDIKGRPGNGPKPGAGMQIQGPQRRGDLQ
jgi:hypothetical protein